MIAADSLNKVLFTIYRVSLEMLLVLFVCLYKGTQHKQGQLEKQGMGNGVGTGTEICAKSCTGREDSELTVILFMTRTRDN